MNQYTVFLKLNYEERIEIETEEEDEEKIKENVRQGFIQDVLDVDGARDLLEKTEAVKIKKEAPEGAKTYLVCLDCRSVTINHYVQANSEEEARENYEDNLTLQFSSEDENTDCEVSHYTIDYVEEVN